MFEYVNMMDKLMKYYIIIDQIGDENKVILKDFLMNYDEGMWKYFFDVLY